MAKNNKNTVNEIEVAGPIILTEKKPCFTCGKSFPASTNQRILAYKEIHSKTGQDYVYFKNNNGQISITKAKGFKPKKGQEYALVSEFGNIPDSNMVEVTNE